MPNVMRRVPGLALVSVLLLLPVVAGAADAGPLDRKDLDQRVYKILAEVIDQGADLYNPPKADQNGCYRIYEGALIALRPLVEHHPEWQDAIKKGLDEARLEPNPGKAAHRLRKVIDQMRTEAKAGASATMRKTTLWERLGSEAGVKKIVDDFVESASKDAKVDFLRGGKVKNLDVGHLKKELVDQISSISDGPFKYTGKSMKDAHKGMGITDAQFDAIAQDFRQALVKNNVKAEDITALLLMVGGTRSDIVESAR